MELRVKHNEIVIRPKSGPKIYSRLKNIYSLYFLFQTGFLATLKIYATGRHILRTIWCAPIKMAPLVMPLSMRTVETEPDCLF